MNSRFDIDSDSSGAARPSDPRVVSAGSLPPLHQPKPRDDLKHLALVELSAEVLSRLRSGEAYDGTDELLLAEQLGQVLARKLDVHLNRFSAQRHHDLLSPIFAELSPGDLQGATIVDLGCGALNPFTFSFLLLMLGAERAYAIDVEPVQNVEIAVRALATAAGWLLLEPKRILGRRADMVTEDLFSNLNGFQLPLLAAGDPAGIAPLRLIHRIESVHSLSLPNDAADVVFSVSLLEHLDRVEDALESLRRITKPGGLGVHVVDFVDHGIYSNAGVSPFEFLTVQSAESLVHGSNRIRCDEFCALFEQHGFVVSRVDRWAHLPAPTDEERAKFVEPYRSMSQANLSTTGARIFARRL
jgi:SAM-dependent methyltransferase